MFGAFIKSWKAFMEGLRDEDTSTTGMSGVMDDPIAVTLTTGGGARTITAKELLGSGFFVVDCQDEQTMTTPTATLIVNAIKGVQVGTQFVFAIRNTGDATITLAAGTDVTLATGNTNTIATVNTRSFLGRVTGVSTPAVTIYSLQASAH